MELLTAAMATFTAPSRCLYTALRLALTRYDERADRDTADALTAAERAELESLVRATSLLAGLQIAARVDLARLG